MFESRGLKVVVGVQPDELSVIAEKYLSGDLELGTNLCDH
jgi:hypothetical protein